MVVEAIKTKELEAASLLSRKWRNQWQFHMKKLAENYLLVGPSIQHVKSISFEALSMFLREAPIIALTRAIVSRVHQLALSRHGHQSPTLAPENVNVRVVMAALMIAFRPSHVFEQMGTPETILYESATRMINRFEEIVKCIAFNKGIRDVPFQLTDGFSDMLYEYLKNFKEWKVPDEAKLTNRIKHALHALYNAEDALPPNEPDDSKLKIELKIQISRLREKLVQIAGPQPLEEFDAARRSKDFSKVFAVQGVAYTEQPERLTNEQLAHELLVDNAFQIDDCYGENPVLDNIRQCFHKAFWDSLESDLLLAEQCYVRVIRVLKEIRNGIQDLAGERESQAISGAIDIDHIESQAAAQAITWPDCKNLIGGVVEIMQRMQAPKRDPETREKWRVTGRIMLDADDEPRMQPRALCKGLEFLLGQVNIMRIDAANARLRLIAPVIREHGIEYEQGKFQGKLNDGTLTLQRTQAWILKSMRSVVAAGTIKLEDLVSGNKKAFVDLHTTSITSLIFAQHDGPVTLGNAPETLLFDVTRINIWKAKFNDLVDGSTMLVKGVQHIIDRKLAPHQPERVVQESVMKHLADAIILECNNKKKNSTSFKDTITTALCQKLDEELMMMPGTDGKREKMLKEISNTVGNSNDSVRILMASRVQNIWLAHMILGHKCETSNETFTKIIHPLLPLIEQAAKEIMAVANINRAVHTRVYNEVFAETARKIAMD